ncbi:hypothetical protein K3556_15695 (plasmid) [Aliiroseovarius sp. M344]|uniref:hypothetical protein n=1 Tax=Aliiroseovarius sp. M344 TaxID=2867010 RepID=UPI0021ADFAF2|nr:hypothetical protein [Aliiroseovarius sp. M344]UWQ16026.1 hypothetical protein K3556_15695 [Aliiroseovarius sp. M344]
MVSKNDFRERLAKIAPRNHRKTNRETHRDQDQSLIPWLVSSFLDIVFNGWWFFLSGLAFAALAAFFFLDFVGFQVGLLAILALAAFLYFVLKAEL